MNTFKGELLMFSELPEVWQSEAVSNLGDDVYHTFFIQPASDHVVGKHVLWDFSDSYLYTGSEGFDVVIPISNNSAAFVRIDKENNTAELFFR